MKVKVVIFGTGSFSQIVFEYLKKEKKYDIVAFTEDEKFYRKRRIKEFLGLPVVSFNEIEYMYPPEEYKMFIAIGYSNNNRLRAEKYYEAKLKGYKFITYVSGHAFVWDNVEIGENVFIFENNVLQPFVKIGNNTILWSGNHIGHHSNIGNHVFISSHVVISGHCNVGDYTFIGVNATIADGVKIAGNNIIGASSLVLEDTEPGYVYVGIPARKLRKISYSEK